MYHVLGEMTHMNEMAKNMGRFVIQKEAMIDSKTDFTRNVDIWR